MELIISRKLTLIRASRLLIVCAGLCGTSFAAAPAASDYTIMQGRARVQTFGEQMLSVVVTPTSDASIRHVFRLGLGRVAPRVDLTLPSVSFEYRGTELVLMDAEDQVFYRFVVAGHDGELRTPRGFTSVAYGGIGLSHSIYRVTTSTSSLVGDGECYDCGPDNPDTYWDSIGGTKPSCSQGGVGSTACSVEVLGFTCSVSCASGYYACCNVRTGCKCYRE
jgi:hypothetical protein